MAWASSARLYTKGKRPFLNNCRSPARTSPAGGEQHCSAGGSAADYADRLQHVIDWELLVLPGSAGEAAAQSSLVVEGANSILCLLSFLRESPTTQVHTCPHLKYCSFMACNSPAGTTASPGSSPGSSPCARHLAPHWRPMVSQHVMVSCSCLLAPLSHHSACLLQLGDLPPQLALFVLAMSAGILYMPVRAGGASVLQVCQQFLGPSGIFLDSPLLQ